MYSILLHEDGWRPGKSLWRYMLDAQGTRTVRTPSEIDTSGNPQPIALWGALGVRVQNRGVRVRFAGEALSMKNAGGRAIHSIVLDAHKCYK